MPNQGDPKPISAGKLVPAPPVKTQPNCSTTPVAHPVMSAGGIVATPRPSDVHPNRDSKPVEPAHVAATKSIFRIF